MNEFVDEIVKEAQTIRHNILNISILSKNLDKKLSHIPSPFYPQPNNIKLLVIGQDPTVRSEKSRIKINTVLNLNKAIENKKSSLTDYLKIICRELGIDLCQNVYATNLYKCFFKEPPADDESILTNHFQYWFDLLKKEVNSFPEATIITLGRSILRQLINTGINGEVSYYWGYNGEAKSNLEFFSVKPNENKLLREIFPFPHQPSYSRKLFYKRYLSSYINYMCKNISHH